MGIITHQEAIHGIWYTEEHGKEISVGKKSGALKGSVSTRFSLLIAQAAREVHLIPAYACAQHTIRNDSVISQNDLLLKTTRHLVNFHALCKVFYASWNTFSKENCYRHQVSKI